MQMMKGTAEESMQEAVESALEADREKSLRDVFAGVAFGALLTRNEYVGAGDKWGFFASQAYAAAEAMLRARQRAGWPKERQ